jgi:hypothetical protein
LVEQLVFGKDGTTTIDGSRILKDLVATDWRCTMMLGGQRMNPLGVMQWAGIILAGFGVVMMCCAPLLSSALVDAGPQAELPRLFDWPLLSGMACLIGGGILVQFTWRTWNGPETTGQTGL